MACRSRFATSCATWGAATALLVISCAGDARGWGPQGHRLVAHIAAGHLTPVARQNVTWLLERATLMDVAGWADQQLDRDPQTARWHYVNIPAGAGGYDRTRDCPPSAAPPREPGDGRWRDCVVDRILYFESRLGDATLPRRERATALRFLVHLVADVHQPFHAIDTARGGNGIAVSVLGSGECGAPGRTPYPCNLHAVWDSTLIARRELPDRRYAAELTPRVATLRSRAAGRTAAEWANESHALARTAVLPDGGDADAAYVRRHTTVIEERLVLAGLRLAETLNARLRSAPPEYH